LSLRINRIVSRALASAPVFLPLFAVSYCAAYWLRFSGDTGVRYKDLLLGTLLWVMAAKWVTFLWFRVYQGWSRHVNFHDLVVLVQAVTASAVAVVLVDALCLPGLAIPRGIILIDWGTTLLAFGAARALPRLLTKDTWYFLHPAGTPCLIVGADDSGELLLRAIRRTPCLTYRVIGFVDDRSQVQHLRLDGVPVIGRCDDLPRLTEQHGIEEVLITSGDLSGREVRRLVDMGRAHGFRVKVLPSYEQLLEERVAIHPRAVAIEDLLSRPSVEIDLTAVRDWLAGQVIMVTGSAGSIGSEICRQLLKLRPERLVLVDRSETGQFYLERELERLTSQVQIDTCLADLTDRDRLEALFRDTRPDIIFHAAAYKHVPLMESHCGEAVKNIVLATRNVVDLADACGAKSLVMISTDKAVNPTSVMGACKRLAEQYVQARSAGSVATATRFVTVRFGNVLDSSGSVVPIFREQIARGGPVTVTHPDITRYFMLIPEAAQLVIQAGAMGQGGEIFVLDMGEPVRILDLAHDMIRLSGMRAGDDIEVQIVGLRPGEKLFEELYDAGESHQRTTHPKIMVADSARRHVLEVIHDIGRLEGLVNEPNERIKAALQQIVPRQIACDLKAHRAAA
jgi:FlaA1/EpsC-like NDP-sugar epimerase